MSRPLSRPEAEAARIQREAQMWAACYRAVTGHDPSPTDERTLPWDEGLEQRIDHIAATYDEETRTHQPLRKRTR